MTAFFAAGLTLSTFAKANLHIRPLPTGAKPDFSSRVTVPVLRDKQNHTIASHDFASLALELAEKWLPLAKNPAELRIRLGISGIAKKNGSQDEAALPPRLTLP